MIGDRARSKRGGIEDTTPVARPRVDTLQFQTQANTGLQPRAAAEESAGSQASIGIADLRDPILTAAEVALELRCCKAQVHKLINGSVKGISKLPSISIGRKRVIRRSSFENWKQQNESRTGE